MCVTMLPSFVCIASPRLSGRDDWVEKNFLILLIIAEIYKNPDIQGN